jgi:hypothetical protein
VQTTAPAALVSVVIPTRNRAHLVLGAVESVLAQTHTLLEVIVVIDGPEGVAGESTADALSSVTDSRLRVVALEESVGGGEARNVGVRAAGGEWIAFLDDDDLWMPEKLAVQLEHAGRLPLDVVPVLTCAVLARSPEWEEVWPREPYKPGEKLSEYLFCRKGWRYGSALLQTSTLMAPRVLLLAVPFARNLKRHQDWDWLLRAIQYPSVRIEPAGSNPLAVFRVEGNRASVGRVHNWRFSLVWARERKALLTRRAFTGFLATECAAQAQGEGWRAQFELLAVFLKNGVPPVGDAARFFIFLCVPQARRRWLRELFRAHRAVHEVPNGRVPEVL